MWTTDKTNSLIFNIGVMQNLVDTQKIKIKDHDKVS
jgi:hypothetical protein